MACPSKVCNPPNASNVPENWLDEKVSLEIKEGMKELVLDNDTLRKERDIFLENVLRGLKKETHPQATIKCFPTYVQDLPNGTETGKFLALDLGGSNFRVLLVELEAGKCDMKSKIYEISKEVMTSNATELFDFIAACLADFASENNLLGTSLPLGFTFSFPTQQRGLSSGLLIKWTKGFDVEGVVGEDVVKLLSDAIEKRGDVKIDVCAVLNDTTGTLMSCAWKAPDCRIGLIVGTGNNGCYMERQENVELFDEPDMGSGKVIINLEMGAFGEDGAIDFIRTDIDKAIDEITPNVGQQLHEKMISGMYIGEIVRRYILKFTEAGLLFGGQGSDALSKEWELTCENVTDIESDPVGVLTNVKTILDSLGLSHASEQDCINVRYICQVVTRRSAHLVASALSVLIPKVNEPKVTIGVDGSVYKHHPHFRRVMEEKIHELLPPGYKFELMLSEDGSGRGAAIIAAVAARKKAEMAG